MRTIASANNGGCTSLYFTGSEPRLIAAGGGGGAGGFDGCAGGNGGGGATQANSPVGCPEPVFGNLGGAVK